MYSPRTTCPKCASKIRLEDVRFTPNFPCLHCGAEICVADRAYSRIIAWFAWTAGIGLPYAVTSKWWLALVCWIPTTWFIGFVLTFLWTYAGKYLCPPRVQLYVPPRKTAAEESSILHLDSD